MWCVIYTFHDVIGSFQITERLHITYFRFVPVCMYVCAIVADDGIEPSASAYETDELPLLQPTIIALPVVPTSQGFS